MRVSRVDKTAGRGPSLIRQELGERGRVASDVPSCVLEPLSDKSADTSVSDVGGLARIDRVRVAL